jgi:hypothetical protein
MTVAMVFLYLSEYRTKPRMVLNRPGFCRGFRTVITRYMPESRD